ncbi:hypothetical protein N185_16815 [Sinorhizobium sp. GW3]|nr:hypothetical protein N185_16815 [Sinorhizobium sp. GW3]
MNELLDFVLNDVATAALAVSGGVDSMTLAVFAHRHMGRERVTMMHAVSAAVPLEATERVRIWAKRENFRLEMIDAGEFDDENYRSNPANRCFFCKGNLYGTIAGLTEATIFSGTNLDDLAEYRPGLEAAKRHAVRHPFVEAGMTKSAVRYLARDLGLGNLADLPASPCLSSRVETAIRIEPALLQVVHAVEKLINDCLSPAIVRCRLRSTGIVIELDRLALKAADLDTREGLVRKIAMLLPSDIARKPIGFSAYRNGSAFLHEDL